MLRQPVAALEILKREADEATNLAQRVAWLAPAAGAGDRGDPGVCFGGLQIALGADFGSAPRIAASR